MRTLYTTEIDHPLVLEIDEENY